MDDAGAPEDRHAHPRRIAAQVTEPGRLERAAAIFRAMGEVSRLRLLERLTEGELCVSELAEESGDDLSTVSQRLRVLRTEGLVTRRRDGKHILYALADEHITTLVRNALSHAHEDPTHDEDGTAEEGTT